MRIGKRKNAVTNPDQDAAVAPGGRPPRRRGGPGLGRAHSAPAETNAESHSAGPTTSTTLKSLYEDEHGDYDAELSRGNVCRMSVS